MSEETKELLSRIVAVLGAERDGCSTEEIKQKYHEFWGKQLSVLPVHASLDAFLNSEEAQASVEKRNGRWFAVKTKDVAHVIDLVSKTKQKKKKRFNSSYRTVYKGCSASAHSKVNIPAKHGYFRHHNFAEPNKVQRFKNCRPTNLEVDTNDPDFHFSLPETGPGTFYDAEDYSNKRCLKLPETSIGVGDSLVYTNSKFFDAENAFDSRARYDNESIANGVKNYYSQEKLSLTRGDVDRYGVPCTSANVENLKKLVVVPYKGSEKGRKRIVKILEQEGGELTWKQLKACYEKRLSVPLDEDEIRDLFELGPNVSFSLERLLTDRLSGWVDLELDKSGQIVLKLCEDEAVGALGTDMPAVFAPQKDFPEAPLGYPEDHRFLSRQNFYGAVTDQQLFSEMPQYYENERFRFQMPDQYVEEEWDQFDRWKGDRLPVEGVRRQVEGLGFSDSLHVSRQFSEPNDVRVAPISAVITGDYSAAPKPSETNSAMLPERDSNAHSAYSEPHFVSNRNLLDVYQLSQQEENLSVLSNYSYQSKRNKSVNDMPSYKTIGDWIWNHVSIEGPQKVDGLIDFFHDEYGIFISPSDYRENTWLEIVKTIVRIGKHPELELCNGLVGLKRDFDEQSVNSTSLPCTDCTDLYAVAEKVQELLLKTPTQSLLLQKIVDLVPGCSACTILKMQHKLNNVFSWQFKNGAVLSLNPGAVFTRETKDAPISSISELLSKPNGNVSSSSLPRTPLKPPGLVPTIVNHSLSAYDSSVMGADKQFKEIFLCDLRLVPVEGRCYNFEISFLLKDRSLVKKRDLFQEILDQFYSANWDNPQWFVTVFEEGLCCVICDDRYENTKRYYRAKVLGMNDSCLLATLVDYARIVTDVPLRNARKLKPEFLDVAAFGIDIATRKFSVNQNKMEVLKRHFVDLREMFLDSAEPIFVNIRSKPSEKIFELVQLRIDDVFSIPHYFTRKDLISFSAEN